MKTRILARLVTALVSVVFTAELPAQGTAFTYQGQLTDAGQPANGSYDLTSSLFGTNTGGVAIAGPTTNAAVSVSNGLFTVTLDFGSGVFDGSDRWLEIGVRTNGVGAFTTLSPRQQILSVPYAIYAGKAGMLDGALPGSQLAGTYPNAVTFDNAANSFTGNGAGLTALNASQLTSGTVPVAALGNAWTLAGNTATTPGTHFLGTTDNQALELKVNNARALRIEPGASPNLIGGFNGNNVTAGVLGASIGGGGDTNRVTDDYGTVSGGAANQAGDNAGTVVDRRYATVGGGEGNTSSGSWSTVGGGRLNASSMIYATVGGGYGNSSMGSWAAIGGGNLNSAQNSYGTISGGDRNTNSGLAATISGGSENTVATSYATVGGGRRNYVAGNQAYIAGGEDNRITAADAFIGAGNRNTNSGLAATIAGGQLNSVTELNCAIGGGALNRATATYSVIGGGNMGLCSGDYATIGGGNQNTNESSTTGSTIAGGQKNKIGNAPSSVFNAAIGGGFGNTVKVSLGTIAGGQENSIAASAFNGAIGGGYTNQIDTGAWYSTIPGGIGNVTRGEYSLAAGRRAVADHDGAFVWGDSQDASITSTANDQVTFRCQGGVRFLSGAGGANQTVSWTPGSASWTFSSDRNLKENFKSVDARAVMEKVCRLSITEWNYKGYDQRHIGPMAQDFHAAFPLNDSTTTLNDADLHGVALAAIQGLNQKLTEELKQKHTEIAELRQTVNELKRLVQALSANVNGGAE